MSKQYLLSKYSFFLKVLAKQNHANILGILPLNQLCLTSKKLWQSLKLCQSWYTEKTNDCSLTADYRKITFSQTLSAY